MKSVRILIAVIAIFLLVVPAALAQVKPPQPAPVPSVEGKSLNDAQKALVSAGFNAVVSHENVTDPGKNNVVLKQKIAPGTSLAKGTSVPVVVGKYAAPAQQPVPSVVGMPLDKAQAALSQAKLNAAVTMQPVDQPQRNNVVLAQNVPAGKTLSPGSMVPIVVGKYTAPAQQPVPSVVGMPLDKAQAALSQAKLNAAVTMQPVDQPQRNNVVLAQNVPAGKTLSPGSMVSIVVGKYAAPTVPNVTGMPLAIAQKALAANKLNAVVSMEAVTEPAKNNVVLRQQAAPGTALAAGSQVSLVVGRYTAPAAIPMPNVTGMIIDQARQLLEKQGWKVETMRMVQNDARKSNLVLQQTPAAGTQAIPQQTTVKLTIGFVQPTGGQLNRPIEPDAITVPDTVGKSLADARNITKSRGWSPERLIVHERVVSDPKLAAGIVRSQKPVGGSAVPYKSPGPIEIWVDIYKKQP